MEDYDTLALLRRAAWRSRKCGKTSVPKISICSSRMWLGVPTGWLDHNLLQTGVLLFQRQQPLHHRLRWPENPVLLPRVLQAGLPRRRRVGYHGDLLRRDRPHEAERREHLLVLL